MKLNEMAKEVHKNAVDHGWWKENRSFGEIIALMHSELSEALEEIRNGRKPNEIYSPCDQEKCAANIGGECSYVDELHIKCGIVDSDIIPKPEGVPIELADCIIRILDYCGKEDINIEAALHIKHEYNKTRPYRHGGKII